MTFEEQYLDLKRLYDHLKHEVELDMQDPWRQRGDRLAKEVFALKIEHDALKAEVERLEVFEKRYKTLRRFTPFQFDELYRANIEQGTRFDDLVDNAGEKK